MITEKELETLYKFCDRCYFKTVCKENEMLKTAHDRQCSKFQKKIEIDDNTDKRTDM